MVRYTMVEGVQYCTNPNNNTNSNSNTNRPKKKSNITETNSTTIMAIKRIESLSKNRGNATPRNC